MQVCVGGIPADEEVSTAVWQYLQSIPSSPTWCLWLNCTGCITSLFWFVMYEDLDNCVNTKKARPATNTATMRLAFAM
jgi:hypothetical protein